MTKLVADYGLVLVFLVIFLESAGVPFLPGELVLIAAAVLAGKHHFSIVSVIVVAAIAATLGYVAGYWLGREGGRRLLDRWDFVKRYADRALPPSERFFEKHGSKTVFIGRFIVLLRATAAWLAGITGMGWWRFLVWDVAGAIVWATAYGLLAYYAGRAVVDAVSKYSEYGVGAIVLLGLLAFGAHHLIKKRLAKGSAS